jgi:putative oxidoreductase
MGGSTGSDLAWALVRVTFGLSLAFGHGFDKVFGGNMERFAAGVAALGFPAPAFFAWAAALSEFVGGLLVAVGMFTRPAAALAGFTMLVALYRHRAGPFSGMEMALLFFTVMVLAIAVGGGRYSVDATLRGGRSRRGSMLR